ncbi:NAD-dependent epimerase/dehydratase family protein, partial [Escherichia coli]|uniref:NAD-dependent epimerase/dehydratase family protein n=1 Tax=Escherichia coli TaxID=562 RepID=UPI0038536481
MVIRLALVTGATGGLGRELVDQLLARGYRVRATGRDAAIGARLKTEFVPADLTTDPLAPLVAGVDMVFHLAALSSPWGSRAAFK